MPYKIPADKCISCGTCEVECPVKAISEGKDCFIINPEICNECKGFFDSARCMEACPNDCPEPETNHQETIR